MLSMQATILPEEILNHLMHSRKRCMNSWQRGLSEKPFSESLFSRIQAAAGNRQASKQLLR